MAKTALKDGGGATRGSTNADSYAIVANGLYWMDTTGVLPARPVVPKSDSKASSMSSDDPTNSDIVISLYADLGYQGFPSDVDMGTVFDNQIALLVGDVDKGTAVTSAAPAATYAPAQDMCGVSWKVFFNFFHVKGQNFDMIKFGENGEGLKAQIAGCGVLTAWSFSYTPNDASGYQWVASGNLPIGTKACIGRAIVSAGGSTTGGCTGSG